MYYNLLVMQIFYFFENTLAQNSSNATPNIIQYAIASITG